MSEVHVVPEVHVRRHRTPSFWLPLSFLMIVALIVTVPTGMLAQGGGRGGAGGGRGAAPAAGAPAVPGAPPVPGPAAAAPAGQVVEDRVGLRQGPVPEAWRQST
jgi:hypothetical protein